MLRGGDFLDNNKNKHTHLDPTPPHLEVTRLKQLQEKVREDHLRSYSGTSLATK